MVRRVSVFLLLLAIFVPKVDTLVTFSEAPICVFDVGREVTGPIPAPLEISSRPQDQNLDFLDFLDFFYQSGQGNCRVFFYSREVAC